MQTLTNPQINKVITVKRPLPVSAPAPATPLTVDEE